MLFVLWCVVWGARRHAAQGVDDLTFDLGEGCFPRFVELTPRSLKILFAASRSVSLPLEPLLTLMVKPLIATQSQEKYSL